MLENAEPDILKFQLPNMGGQGTHEITCYRWGAKNPTRTVLCVHGLTRNGRDFDYLARELIQDEGVQVLAPDMPGRGKSQWLADPTGYSYPAYAGDIIELLAQAGVDKLQWVGTSMGGIIAMAFAAAQPGRIEALVLNDVGSIVSSVGLTRIMSYAGARPDFASLPEAQAALRVLFAPFGISSEEHWEHLFAHSIVPQENGRFTLAYDPAITAALKTDGPITDVDLSALFAATLTIPVLLFRGLASDLLARETAVAMREQHPRLTLKEVPGAGHAPALMEQSQVEGIRFWLQAQSVN